MQIGVGRIMDDYAKIVGRNLHALRVHFKLTQAALAADIGCTEQSIRYWEKGRGIPVGYYLPLIADRFHCSIDYLFGRD